MSTTEAIPSLREANTARLFLTRGIVAIGWAGIFAAASNSLCTCTAEPCPLFGGLLTGRRSRANATARGSTSRPAPSSTARQPEALNVYEVQAAEGSIKIRA